MKTLHKKMPRFTHKNETLHKKLILNGLQLLYEVVCIKVSCPLIILRFPD